MGIKIGNVEITREMMPSYIAGNEYSLRMYQAKQERLNAKLQTGIQPMQVQPQGQMEQNGSAWNSQQNGGQN